MWGEVARRLYTEVVRGRTRVRVVESTPAPPTSRARFVLSPYRSGTTLLRYALDTHPDVACPPETDHLVHLGGLLDDPAALQGLSDLGYDVDQVRSRVSRLGRSFLDEYADGRDVTNWVDKSPRYAERPGAIQLLYPDALHVVMHRHPLDQVHSFTRGGSFAHPTLSTDATGRDLVAAAAAYWQRVTAGLQAFGQEHHDRVVVIRYEDLCENPEATLSRVLEHLQVPWDPAVLDYHRAPHDVGRQAGRVVGTTGFRRSTGAWSAWPSDWVTDAWSTVAGTAEELGYRPDGGA